MRSIWTDGQWVHMYNVQYNIVGIEGVGINREREMKIIRMLRIHSETVISCYF